MTRTQPELALTPKREWQSVDVAPGDETPVLVFHPAWDLLQVGIYYRETNTWQQPNGDLLRKPMCWQSLPPPPTASWQDSQPR